jgi:hypothetical protein
MNQWRTKIRANLFIHKIALQLIVMFPWIIQVINKQVS